MRNRTLSKRRGQALAEWAIVLPAVLLLTLGVIQFSLVLVGKVVVNHAAYMATRAALVGEDPLKAAQIVCSPIAGTSAPAEADPIALPGWGDLQRSQFSVPKTTVKVVSDKDTSIRVDVTHDFELMLPVVDFFFRDHAPKDSKVFVTGQDSKGTSYMRLTERTTLPRVWSKTADLGLPAP